MLLSKFRKAKLSLPSQNQIVLVDQSFTDYDEFKSYALNWDLDFILTSNNGFNADFHYSLVNHCVFGHVRLQCSIHQLGQAPGDMRTFVIPANDEVSYSWRQHQIKGNTLQLFPENGELYSISDPTFDCFVISFPTVYIQQTLLQLEGNHVTDITNSERVWLVDKETLSKLRRLCRLYKIGMQDPDAVLLKTLLSSLLLRPKWIKTTFKEGRQLIDFCHDFVNENPSETIRMKDIVLLTGKSERSIQYSFKKQMGITPFEYIKSLKLQNVFKDLKVYKELSISEIAHRNGFSHLGQFSTDFKRKFGLTPTQRRNSKDLK